MKNITLLTIALALVACGKKDETPSGSADPVDNAQPGDPERPSFDCGTLLTDAEVETSCGAKGSVKKLADEGSTQTVGASKILHVCSRDIAFESGAHVTMQVNFTSGGQTAEEIVRGKMEAAGTAGWGKKVKSMTGYVGSPPSTDGSTETLELRGLVRNAMIDLTTSRKTGEPWACSEDGLNAIGALLANRVPPGPSR
jgi:hypothetical protein